MHYCAINPFNLASMPGVGPPRGYQRGGAGTYGPPNDMPGAGSSGWNLSRYPAMREAGRSLIKELRGDALLLRHHDMSAEEMQKEYVQQRAVMIAELQRAKEDAEEERRKIMLKIHNVLGAAAGKWRT